MMGPLARTTIVAVEPTGGLPPVESVRVRGMLWWQLLEDGVVELGRRVEPER